MEPPVVASSELIQLCTAQAPSWDKILVRIQSNDPTEVLDKHPMTGMTALHFAVCKRKSKGYFRRLAVIKALLKCQPDLATTPCEEKGYTPLAYASFSQDDDDEDHAAREKSLKRDAEIIKVFLSANPNTIRIKGRDGNSPLNLHIMSMSRKSGSTTTTLISDFTNDTSAPPASQQQAASTTVLKVLIAHSPREILVSGLEKLYACNTMQVMSRFAKEEVQARQNKLKYGRQTRASNVMEDFWVWDWVLRLLEGIHDRTQGSQSASRFNPLHVAAQIPDCPTPFLTLAMRSYPSEMRVADRKTLNLPLHYVSEWQIPVGQSLCRKSMSLTSLVADFPTAIDIPNRKGFTPPQLEEQSGSVV